MKAIEILDAMKKYNVSEHLYEFGIRGDNIEVNVGDELDNSYGWDYENDCQSEEKLDGTCSVGINDLWLASGDDTAEEDFDDIEKIRIALDYFLENYHYTNISVIGGWGCEGGEDPNEKIIYDAKVICVLQLS